MTRRSLWFRGGGSPHRGWYRNIWCDSSWELAFVIGCLEGGHEIVRCTENFKYPFRNGFKWYRPDFIVDGTYYEVKGVMDGRSKRKVESFPYPLVIIGKKEIVPYLDYAKGKYGEEFWRLMEFPER